MLTIPELTKEELAEISLSQRFTRILKRFAKNPSDRKEARKLRFEMELEAMNEGPRDYSVFHPSSLSLGSKDPTVCMRKLVYARTSNRSPNKRITDPNLLNRFETGHDGHSKYQSWLKWDDPDAVNLEVMAERADLGMRGSCDATIDWTFRSGRTVTIGVELKTAAQKSWDKMKNLPMIGHRDQAAAYMSTLGLAAMVFFYECKNDQNFKEFVLPWKSLEPRWERIEERLSYMNGCVESGTLPPRRLTPSECKGCPFEDECKPFRAVGRGNVRLTKMINRRVNDGES